MFHSASSTARRNFFEYYLFAVHYFGLLIETLNADYFAEIYFYI